MNEWCISIIGGDGYPSPCFAEGLDTAVAAGAPRARMALVLSDTLCDGVSRAMLGTSYPYDPQTV